MFLEKISRFVALKCNFNADEPCTAAPSQARDPEYVAALPITHEANESAD
ncbi:MAG: hypothetical protein AAB938_00425 [Patescibacteria group bacterium]